MATVCPWCKAANPPRTETCIACGKRAADHPSIAGRSLDNTLGDDGDDGPGLGLQLDRGAPISKRQGVSSQQTGGALKNFGDDWDDEPIKGPSLDLDVQPAPRRISAPRMAAVVEPPKSGRGQAATSVSRPSMKAVVVEPPPRSTPERAVERKVDLPERTSAASVTSIDPYEVSVLADYGKEPKAIWQTVPYAVRVTLRRRDLRRALAGVRQALKEAETRRDQRLVELGEVVRPIVEGEGAVGGSLAEAEKTKKTREAALAEASATYRDKAAAIDAEIAAFDGPLAEAKKDADAKSKLYEDAEALRAKHEARRKRVEIEVRNAQVRVQNLQIPLAERQQAQAVIDQARGEREVRAAEEKVATTAAQEAEARRAVARRAVTELETKIGAARARRHELEREFARQGQIRSEGIEAASKEVRHGLADVARNYLRAGASSNDPQAVARKKGVDEAEAQVARLQLDLEKHLRALDSADPEAVKKGLIILAVLVTVLVGSFVAWRVLRRNPYVPESYDKSVHEVGKPK